MKNNFRNYITEEEIAARREKILTYNFEDRPDYFDQRYARCFAFFKLVKFVGAGIALMSIGIIGAFAIGAIMGRVVG